MTYLELKRIKGRLYKYARKSRWIHGKSKHSSKYIGPVQPVKTWKRGRKRAKGGGRKPALFTRALEKNEHETLQQALTSSKSFTKERARILQLSSEGKPAKEIAATLAKEARSVRNAIKDFNKRGMQALQRGKTTGRKPVFDAEKRATILALASTKPSNAGEAFTTWSLPKLKQSLAEKGLYISVEGLRQVLRKEGFKLKKSRKFQYSDDPDFVKKNSK